MNIEQGILIDISLQHSIFLVQYSILKRGLLSPKRK